MTDVDAHPGLTRQGSFRNLTGAGGLAALPGENTADPLLDRLSTPTAWLMCIVGSAAVGLVMGQSALLATAHMAVTLIALLCISVFSRRPGPIVAITVYAGLGDVLWRVAGARGPYEASKYAIAIGFTVLVVRFIPHPKNLAPGLTVILLLVPASILTVFQFGPIAAREYIVGNLLGLVALVTAGVACSNLRMRPREIRGLYLIALSPIVSLTALTTAATRGAGSDLQFVDEANFVAAGGFGPNQVSSILCFGGLLVVLTVLQPRVGWHIRAIALVAGCWMVGQAVLTFSRGGVFALVLAAAAIGLTALTQSGQRSRIIVAAGVLIVIALQILSWAGAFTGGASDERFTSVDTTNRSEIARTDVDLFLAQPWGVGVGISPAERDYPGEATAHTEATRLMAEHGMAGLGVIVILFFLSARMVRASRGWQRLAAVGLVTMATAQTFHSATRIGSIAVAFGLAALLLDQEDDQRIS